MAQVKQVALPVCRLSFSVTLLLAAEPRRSRKSLWGLQVGRCCLPDYRRNDAGPQELEHGQEQEQEAVADNGLHKVRPFGSLSSCPRTPPGRGRRLTVFVRVGVCSADRSSRLVDVDARAQTAKCVGVEEAVLVVAVALKLGVKLGQGAGTVFCKCRCPSAGGCRVTEECSPHSLTACREINELNVWAGVVFLSDQMVGMGRGRRTLMTWLSSTRRQSQARPVPTSSAAVVCCLTSSTTVRSLGLGLPIQPATRSSLACQATVR